MNRCKGFLTGLRLSNSLSSSPLVRFRPLLSSQVTHFSHLFRPLSLLSKQQICNIDFLSIHQNLYFSSNPNSIVEAISSNDWSEELEDELSDSNITWTHETVIYILKSLDKDPEKASQFFSWVCERIGFKSSIPVYSLLLRIFVTGGSLKHFWLTLRGMREQGCCIDDETYQTILKHFKATKRAGDAAALTALYDKMVRENGMDSLLKKVVGVVTGSEWNDEVENEIGKLKISLSDDFILRVLKELRKYPLKALRFFRWVSVYCNYVHNTLTYNAVARVLGQHDSIAEFWDMIREMAAAGHEMDIDTYIKISRQFRENEMMEDAVKLLELRMDGPYKPPMQHCVNLLKALSIKPRLDLVFRVAKKYEATGHELSKSAYDQIHRCLTSLGKFDEAGKMMKTMENMGYTPDNITYSQLIFGLCKVMKIQEACKVLNEMEVRGCVPDIKTWTILIQGCCAANDLDKALDYFGKMIEKNCGADADLLDVLINGFIHKNKIDGAYILFIEMVKRERLRPWQATYKNMIEKLLGVRKLEEALELLRLMKKHNYPPFSDPFDKCISKFGTVDDASEFLNIFSSKNHPSHPTYRRVFASFFPEGRHSEAKDLLKKSPSNIQKDEEIVKLFGSKSSSSAAS